MRYAYSSLLSFKQREFIWHAGDRANLLQKIAREYTQQTGVEIKAVLPPMTAQSSLILGCETKLDDSFSDKKNAKRAQLSPISSTLPKAQMGLARMERAKPQIFLFCFIGCLSLQADSSFIQFSPCLAEVVLPPSTGSSATLGDGLAEGLPTLTVLLRRWCR